MKFLQAFWPLFGAMLIGVKALPQIENKLKACAKGAHIISIRGEGDDPNGQGYGMMQPLVQNIRAIIPGSTSVPVSYNEVGGIRETNRGAVHHLKHHIKNYAERCPNTKIILAGYSEGAGVVMNTLCGTLDEGWQHTWALKPEYEKYIAAVLVYGDWTRHGGMPWDLGGCTVSSPHPRQNNTLCHRWANKLRSYCHAEDPACCRTGHYEQAHWSYFKRNDMEASHWIKRKFRQAIGEGVLRN